MTLVRTPLMSSNVELSEGDGLYWKQVLPLDYKLDYAGHELHFDKQYINHVITAYKQNALGDPVAFQLADDENQHDNQEDLAKLRNHDPQRYRGSVKAMKLLEGETDNSRNGLWCGFELTEAGKKLIDDNKELGVSASLSQGFDPKYPVIMRHVVGTIHPKIKNMKAWDKTLVSLSDVEDDNEEVFSFMPQEDKKPEKVEVDKTELDSLMEYVKAKKAEDEELEQLLKDAADEVEEAEVEETEEPTPVNLSELPEFKAMQERINLSEANAAAEKWSRERAEFARAGVPKAILDLAEPVMKQNVALTVNLSDGKSLDGREQMRKMLNESKGIVDMSEEEGYGRSGDGKTEEEANAEKEKFNTIYDDFTQNGLFG